MPRPTATVVVATRNRLETLKETLDTLATLDPAPDELIVVLVAPTEAIDAVVAAAPLPKTHVMTVRASTREGSVAGRDSAFSMATGDLVVSLDDDCVPVQRDFLDRLAALAKAHPEAGTFTFCEVRDGIGAVGPKNPCYVGAYASAAVAIRRTVYGSFPTPHGSDTAETTEPPEASEATRTSAEVVPLQAASLAEGPLAADTPSMAAPRVVAASRVSVAPPVFAPSAYPRFFTHAYAEADFCLQTYAAGHAVLHDPEILVRRRHTGRLRDLRAKHRFTTRNEFWSVLMRCPFPHILWVAPYRIAAQGFYALRRGWMLDEPRWWWNAVTGIAKPLSARRPVPWPTYSSWMRLARQPLSTRRDLVEAFPAVAYRAGLRPVPFALSTAKKA